MRRPDRTIDEIHAAPVPKTKRGQERELRELDRAIAREERKEKADDLARLMRRWTIQVHREGGQLRIGGLPRRRKAALAAN